MRLPPLEEVENGPGRLCGASKFRDGAIMVIRGAESALGVVLNVLHVFITFTSTLCRERSHGSSFCSRSWLLVEGLRV